MAKNDADRPDFTKYADKPATALQEEFAEWLITEVYGGESPFKTQAAQNAFIEGVRLATALRMPFQRSEDHQAVLEESRATGTKATKKAAPAAKKVSKRTAAAAEEDEVEEARPRKATAKKATKAARRPAGRDEEEAEAPSRPARRPARRRAAAAADGEAPF